VPKQNFGKLITYLLERRQTRGNHDSQGHDRRDLKGYEPHLTGVEIISASVDELLGEVKVKKVNK